MADRIVYLVDTLTRDMEASELAFVDDTRLGAILAQGYEVTSTLPDRKVEAGRKKVKATMMVLRPSAENRGVSVAQPSGRFEPDRRGDLGGGAISVTDAFGSKREVSLSRHLTETLDRMSQALIGLGDAGHLGGNRTQSFPGVTVISGEVVAKAYDVGVGAAMRGAPVESCPFPSMSEAQQQWLRGYRMGQAQAKNMPGADPVALGEARDAGRATARQFGQDDEVSCPYPPGSPLREAWMDGFREGGGRVE